MNLSFKERLYLIGKAVSGQFNLPESSIGMKLLQSIYPSRGGDPPLRTTKNTLEGFNSMAWLRSCSNKVACSVASSRWRLYVRRSSGKPVPARAIQRAFGLDRRKALEGLRAAGDVTEVEEHPFLDFMNEGNTVLKGFACRRLTQIGLDLVGEAFLLIERNALGAPIRQWPLPAHWVTDTPTPSHQFYKVNFRGFVGDIPATEVFRITDPNPVHPYGRGSGIAMALSDELETDEYASKHIKTFFYNRARPDFLVYPKEKGVSTGLDQTEVMRLEQDWMAKNQGFWKAYRPYFLTREVGVHEFQQNFANMQLIEILAHTRDTIIQTFGFPPELFGILESSNRATIEAAELLFARWCVEPRLEFQRTEWQEFVREQYDERLILDYDSPVQADKEFQLKARQAMVSTIRVNEWREMQGLQQLEGPEGEMFMKASAVTPVEKLEESDPVDAAQPDVPALPGQAPGRPKPKPVAAGLLAQLSEGDLTKLYEIAGKIDQ